MIMTNRMKRIFKTVLILALVSLIALAAASCGEKYADSKYLGTWKADSAEVKGIALSVEQILGDFTLKLKADGTSEVVINGEKSSGDWEETDNGFKLKDGKDELVFKKTAERKVKLEYQGMYITLEKQ